MCFTCLHNECFTCSKNGCFTCSQNECFTCFQNGFFTCFEKRVFNMVTKHVFHMIAKNLCHVFVITHALNVDLVCCQGLEPCSTRDKFWWHRRRTWHRGEGVFFAWNEQFTTPTLGRSIYQCRVNQLAWHWGSRSCAQNIHGTCLLRLGFDTYS